MKSLLIIPIKRRYGKWLCSYCHHLLHYIVLKKDDVYWCPICKRWRWTGWTIKWVTKKRKLLKYDETVVDRKITLTIMNRRLDKCLESIKERRDITVKVYSSKDFSQEFLKNLIGRE